MALLHSFPAHQRAVFRSRKAGKAATLREMGNAVKAYPWNREGQSVRVVGGRQRQLCAPRARRATSKIARGRVMVRDIAGPNPERWISTGYEG